MITEVVFKSFYYEEQTSLEYTLNSTIAAHLALNYDAINL
jgi:hypothetical protein